MGKTSLCMGKTSLRRRACARNVSFRISLRWLIHIINSVDKTKLSIKNRASAPGRAVNKLKLLSSARVSLLPFSANLKGII